MAEKPELEDARRTAQPLAPGLYLVPTPIGNLQDITLRALHVLKHCDAVACEDTRETQKLLNHFGLRTPTISHHLHNERERAAELVKRVRAGERIAVVSDAGMPGIADPGESAVALAIAAGVAVHALPGANAALTALVASGLPSERFAFRGFLPSKAGERRSALEAVRREIELTAEPQTQIFYETPHRILEALADVSAVFGPEHRIALARELTKLHEEFLRGTVAEVLAALESRERVRGEMVLMLSGALIAREEAGSAESLAQAITRYMRDEKLDEMTAVKRAAKERGVGKSEAYREWQRTRGR